MEVKEVKHQLPKPWKKFCRIVKDCHKKRGSTVHLKTRGCSVLNMETEVIKKLKERLKRDMESSFREKKYIIKGRNREKDLEKIWKDKLIGWKENRYGSQSWCRLRKKKTEGRLRERCFLCTNLISSCTMWNFSDNSGVSALVTE